MPVCSEANPAPKLIFLFLEKIPHTIILFIFQMKSEDELNCKLIVDVIETAIPSASRTDT